ncbi:hypothetical protein JCM13304A_00470 [Desulfothermus okinawensis JCM 13304]
MILVCADIWLSLWPTVTPPVEFNQCDKFYHMGMYFVLACFPFLFITKIDKAVFFALMSLILGIVLEGIQFYVPFREFSIMDIGANEIGILLGILLGEKVHNYLIEKGKSNVLPSSLF